MSIFEVGPILQLYQGKYNLILFSLVVHTLLLYDVDNSHILFGDLMSNFFFGGGGQGTCGLVERGNQIGRESLIDGRR